jgi:hypothetical protein
MPVPPLDGVPPSPPGLGASQNPNPSIQQLSPAAQMGGDMQVTQMVLQAAAEAAKLLDLIGQVQPAFAPTAQMLISQLRAGLKSTLQQGTQGTPEPNVASAMQGLSVMQNPEMTRPQAGQMVQ